MRRHLLPRPREPVSAEDIIVCPRPAEFGHLLREIEFSRVTVALIETEQCVNLVFLTAAMKMESGKLDELIASLSSSNHLARAKNLQSLQVGVASGDDIDLKRRRELGGIHEEPPE